MFTVHKCQHYIGSKLYIRTNKIAKINKFIILTENWNVLEPVSQTAYYRTYLICIFPLFISLQCTWNYCTWAASYLLRGISSHLPAGAQRQDGSLGSCRQSLRVELCFGSLYRQLVGDFWAINAGLVGSLSVRLPRGWRVNKASCGRLWQPRGSSQAPALTHCLCQSEQHQHLSRLQAGRVKPRACRSQEQGACTAGAVMFAPGSPILSSPSATGDLYWIHGNGFSTLRFHQLVTMGCVLAADWRAVSFVEQKRD